MHISDEGAGRDVRCCHPGAPKGLKNSQAKGPVSDEPLESSREAAPKKQPEPCRRQAKGIFQVNSTERRTKKSLCSALLYLCVSNEPRTRVEVQAASEPAGLQTLSEVCCEARIRKEDTDGEDHTAL